VIRLLGLLVFASVCFAQAPASLRGKLIQQDGKDPVIESGGHRISLEADDDTLAVLRDERLNNADVEVEGHPKSAAAFVVNGTQTHPVFVWRNGKRLYVTYWCNVCYIRTYKPGNCWCCQKYTDLDLRESLDE